MMERFGKHTSIPQGLKPRAGFAALIAGDKSPAYQSCPDTKPIPTETLPKIPLRIGTILRDAVSIYAESRTIPCDKGETMRLGLRCLAVVCVAACVPAALWAQCYQDCPERRSITVTGAGTVTADADLAIVRVGYKLYGPDAKTAYASALDTSNAIMQALTSSGIEKSAIESTSQLLKPTEPYELQQRPFSNDEQRQRLFTVTQSWSIRVKPDDAAKTLNTAITAGANDSGWIQWMVSNPDALEAQAAAKALDAAHATAEQLASASGVHLVHLVSAMKTDNYGFVFNGPVSDAIGGLGMGTGFGTEQMGNRQLAINSRRIEFKATVQAVYAIE
jgi:uncharacterized protein